jgi:hypothetical protein
MRLVTTILPRASITSRIIAFSILRRYENVTTGESAKTVRTLVVTVRHRAAFSSASAYASPRLHRYRKTGRRFRKARQGYGSRWDTHMQTISFGWSKWMVSRMARSSDETDRFLAES